MNSSKRRVNGVWAACLVLACVLLSRPALAFTDFVIGDIKVEGLTRIEIGTVFNYLPLAVGETLTEKRAAEAVRALFKTGFFSDVELAREGKVLIVKVAERPSIAKVEFEGNKDIGDDELRDALKRIGLAEGQVFNHSVLEQTELELERQYFARGKYGIRISSQVKPLERNRVEVLLKINEGKVAKIRGISIIGNHAFDDETLLDVFQLTPPTLGALFSGNDQYSRQKLAGDLEALRSYYLDRGYVDFSIDSTQVAITPDKQGVYITVNISEGDVYTVAAVRLAGEMVVPQAELEALIGVMPGEVFSRRRVTDSVDAISTRLGNEGYAFANINPVPELDRAARTVTLTFFVDPGKRVYVRRVNVSGNSRTHDDVLRRELRQLEGGWISTEQVKRSRVRLQRLGYFEEVNVETPAVPGTDDQVDVNFNVKERSTFGSFVFGVGFSQSQGLLLNSSVSEDNFLGTGKRVSATINNSRVNTIYSFSYTNPYYTQDGVSRGFRLFWRTTDAGRANVADFTSDAYGGNVNYGIPLSEYDTLRASVGLEHTKLKTLSTTPQAYVNYINDNKDEFDVYQLGLSWSHDTRNRAFFPDAGILQRLSLDAAVPGSGVTYYKLASRTSWYQALNKYFTLVAEGDVAYGEAYGDTSGFPFFENYYAGGISSVRGYRANSLGPKENGRALGGAFRTLASAEVFFPPPFAADTNSFRFGIFFDIGNVFASVDDFDGSELRYSTGVSALWLSPLGPLTFSFGKALNKQAQDDTEIFQFSLGAAF